jgi:hypothetical protein
MKERGLAGIDLGGQFHPVPVTGENEERVGRSFRSVAVQPATLQARHRQPASDPERRADDAR